ALRHLTTIADFAAAAELIENQRVAALNEQRFHALEEWLIFLPSSLLQQRSELLVCQAWVQHHRLENAQCLATVQRAAALLSKQATALPAVRQQLLHAELVALRIALDHSLEPAESLLLIRETWRQLQPYLTLTHSNVVVWLAANSHRLGESALALEILLTTFEQTTEWPQTARCRLLYSSGVLYWYNCIPVQAEDAFQQGLRLARRYNLHLA
ncbi:MAG TPA: hypothetical protein PKE45_08155, partial [Caldilineaceae bacterium]|nr:hypothetical protein [Caldilineaceae bacterium]